MMHTSVFIQPEVADVIRNLIVELATELDLNYEDEDLPAAASTIERLKEAAAMLLAAGHSPPQEFAHIVERYRKAIN